MAPKSVPFRAWGRARRWETATPIADTWVASSVPVTATVSVAKAAANARRPAVEGSTHRTIEGPEGLMSETPAAPAARTWPTSAASTTVSTWGWAPPNEPKTSTASPARTLPGGSPEGITNARRPGGTRAAIGPVELPASRARVTTSPASSSAPNTRPAT